MFFDFPRLARALELVRLGSHVQTALEEGMPIVALETAVITHGLPPGTNLLVAQDMETILRGRAVTPATIGVYQGRLVVGLTNDELTRLAGLAEERMRWERARGGAIQAPREHGDEVHEEPPVAKVTARDLGPLLAQARSYPASRKDIDPARWPLKPERRVPHFAGTTVGATLVACRLVGIRVFATGGIGGVHREPPFDVSGDLPQMSISPVIVVAAGMKSILHVEATYEYLETLGIPVIGYRTNTFPVFYAREYRSAITGQPLPVPFRADTAQEVAEMAMAHWTLGLSSGVLVVVPPPEDVAIPWPELDAWTKQALEEARRLRISGPAVTPFLLKQLERLSGGRTVDVNVALLRNNAKVARDIARALFHTYPELLRKLYRIHSSDEEA